MVADVSGWFTEGLDAKDLQDVKALRLDPRNREWYLHAVGLVYALTGQYEEAIAAFRSRVLSLQPVTPLLRDPPR